MGIILNTYTPEAVNLVVNGERIGGFTEKNFIQVSPYTVLVKLHAFSASLEELISLESDFVRLTLESKLEVDGNFITCLDLDEECELGSYRYSFSADCPPEVTFSFLRHN